MDESSAVQHRLLRHKGNILIKECAARSSFTLGAKFGHIELWINHRLKKVTIATNTLPATLQCVDQSTTRMGRGHGNIRGKG